MTGSLTRTAGETAGTYAILQGTLGCSANYMISYTGANLTIGSAVVRLLVSGQQDALSTTIANALSGITPSGSATLRLTNGSITENLNITASAAIVIIGGYDSDLLLQQAGAVTTLHGTMTVTNGTVTVSNLAIY
jgi:hypothetical protein